MFTSDAHEIVLVYESMKNANRVSKVVIVNNNKILLLQKNGSLKWELPGGHVESEEKFSQAAVREVREETGYKLESDRLTKLQTSVNDNVKQRVYRYTELVKHKPRLSDEHMDYAWVSRDKLDKYKLSPSTNHLAILSSYN